MFSLSKKKTPTLWTVMACRTAAQNGTGVLDHQGWKKREGIKVDKSCTVALPSRCHKTPTQTCFNNRPPKLRSSNIKQHRTNVICHTIYFNIKVPQQVPSLPVGTLKWQWKINRSMGFPSLMSVQEPWVYPLTTQQETRDPYGFYYTYIILGSFLTEDRPKATAEQATKHQRPRWLADCQPRSVVPNASNLEITGPQLYGHRL